MKNSLDINKKLQELRLKLIEYKSSGIKMNPVDFSELVRAKFILNLPQTIKKYYYTTSKALYSITGVEKTPKKVKNCPDGMNFNLFSTVISSKNRVFVAGGYNDQYVCSNEVIYYDLESSQWGRLIQMSQGRALAAGLYSKGSIYIIGGTNNEGNGLDDMDIINLHNNSMQNVKLRNAKMKPSAFLSEQKIFVTSPEMPCLVEIYNLNGQLIEPIQLDGTTSIIYMIANLKTDMLILSDRKCYYFKKNKEIKLDSVQKLWTQHKIALLGNSLYFRDYVTGLNIEIPIDYW